MKELSKTGWNYKHEFGIVQYGDIKPILIISEYKYWNAQTWGTTYYNLTTLDVSVEEAQKIAADLNIKFDLPEIFDSSNSQLFLTGLQNLYPESEILINKFN